MGTKQNCYKTVLHSCGGDNQYSVIKLKVTLLARLLGIFPCLIGNVTDDVYLLADSDIPSSTTMEPSRSEKMTTFLKERRNKVVQKKIPVDQQLLTIVREEFDFKKRDDGAYEETR